MATGKPPSLSSVSPADVNDDADEKLMEKLVSDDADTLRRADDDDVNEEEPVTEKTTTRKKHIHKVGSVGSSMDDGDHENSFKLVLPKERDMTLPLSDEAKDREDGHRFLFLENRGAKERYAVATDNILLPIGNVISLLETKGSSQDCFRFVPFFLAYLFFIAEFFATSQLHEQYQVLQSAHASIPRFQDTTDVNSTNAWIKEKLPLLGAAVNKSMSCFDIDFVSDPACPGQPYRCDAQINYILAPAKQCERQTFEPLGEDSSEHSGEWFTVATLMLRSPQAWLLVKFSAQRALYHVSNRTITKVTYSGRAATTAPQFAWPYTILMILFIHRLYLVGCIIFFDASLVLRFRSTAVGADAERKTFWLQSRDDSLKRKEQAAFEALSRKAQAKADSYSEKMKGALHNMAVDNTMELFSLCVNVYCFWGISQALDLEGVMQANVLNLLLLILQLFKFGGEAFEPFKVIKMTFTTAMRDITNFVVSLFAVLFIFTVGARCLFGIQNQGFDVIHTFGFFDVFDHVLNTYSRDTSESPLVSNAYYSVAAIIFILLLSQFVIAVIVGAFDETRAEIANSDASRALEPGFTQGQSPQSNFWSYCRGFIHPQTMVWSKSWLTANDLNVLLRDQVQYGSMTFEKLVILMVAQCSNSESTIDETYLHINLPVALVQECTTCDQVDLLFQKFVGVCIKLRAETETNTSAVSEEELQLVIMTRTMKKPIAPPTEKDLLPLLPVAAAAAAGVASPTQKKQGGSQVTQMNSFRVPITNVSDKIHFIQRKIYDMNNAAFRQQCRKDSMRLAMFIFCEYGTIPKSLFNHPRAFVKFFYGNRVFSELDRLRLPDNTLYVDEFKGQNIAGAAVPHANCLCDDQCRAFDVSSHVFVRQIVGEDEMLVSVSPQGPWTAVELEPKRVGWMDAALQQAVQNDHWFAVEAFKVIQIEGDKVTFQSNKQGANDTASEETGQISFQNWSCVERYVIQPTPDSPLSKELKGFENFVIQPGRDYLYITSINEDGAVLRRHASLEDEAYVVSWCTVFGRPTTFTESISSESSLSSSGANDDQELLGQEAFAKISKIVNYSKSGRNNIPSPFTFKLAENTKGSGLVRLELELPDIKFKGKHLFFFNPHFTGAKFTCAQMDAFSESFQKYDELSGEPGQAGPLELGAILDDLGLKMDNNAVLKMMASVDHDCNGVLNFAEFCAAVKSIAVREFFLTGESVENFTYEGFAKMNFTSLGSPDLTTRVLGIEAAMAHLTETVQKVLNKM